MKNKFRLKASAFSRPASPSIDAVRAAQSQSFPWRVKYGPAMHPSVFGADGRSIFSTGNARGRSEEECHLNCTLAAAAPEMARVLDNLKILLETAEKVHPSVNGDGPARVVIEEKFWAYWLVEIGVVLAKARGEIE